MSVGSILIALLVFSAIIVFHELGHFLLARKSGIEVLEFSLGMGPRIVSFEKGGTKYSIKALLLGGSCMMKGEDEDVDEEGSFNNASIPGRMATIAAGPVFNFILAFIFSVVIIGLMGYDPATVLTVDEGSAASKAGLKEGDVITSFNGTHISLGRELYFEYTFADLKDKTLEIEYERDGQKQVISYSPPEKYVMGFSFSNTGACEVYDIKDGGAMQKAGVQNGDRIIAINGEAVGTGEDLSKYLAKNPLSNDPVEVTYVRDSKENTAKIVPEPSGLIRLGFDYNTGRVKTGPLGVLKYSFIEIKYQIKTVIKSLAMLIKGRVSVNDMSGPVGVVNIISDAYEQSKSEGFVIVLVNIMNMIVMLSANLGVMNLLPVPALDGGRLIFLIIEGIRGKAIDRNKEAIVNLIGFAVLMAFILFITYNDIRKFF